MKIPECEEAREDCLKAHRARELEVVQTAEPWETNKDLAAKAGCSIDTIKRTKKDLLQTSADAPNCNTEETCGLPPPPYEGSIEYQDAIEALKLVTKRGERQLIREFIREVWS